MREGIIVVGVLGVFAAGEASAKTIHVSGSGNDKANDGATPQSPLRTLQAASEQTAPGDTVLVDAGTYGSFSITRSGVSGAPIRYIAKEGVRPRIEVSGWNGISIDRAHDIEVVGFEIVGPMAKRTLEQCTANADAATPDPLCNANGISINGRSSDAKPHHILIAGNIVHDCPGGGISAIQADYVRIEDNLVYDTSWHTRYASSGISILTPYNSDASTDTKILILRNRSFGNKTLVKWAKIGRLSDGNGIIVDTTKNDDPNSAIARYLGRTLVENNLSVGNGGSGIHAYRSENVDITFNTTYENGRVVGYAEIFASDSNSVRILNNIMVARGDGAVNSLHKNSTNVVYDYNLYFRGTVAVSGPHDIVLDPRFLSPSLDRTVANFRVAGISPAVDSASDSLTPKEDILGEPRPWPGGRAKPDRGAYEYREASFAGGVPTQPIALPASTARASRDEVRPAGCACRGPSPRTARVPGPLGGAGLVAVGFAWFARRGARKPRRTD